MDTYSTIPRLSALSRVSRSLLDPMPGSVGADDPQGDGDSPSIVRDGKWSDVGVGGVRGLSMRQAPATATGMAAGARFWDAGIEFSSATATLSGAPALGRGEGSAPVEDAIAIDMPAAGSTVHLRLGHWWDDKQRQGLVEQGRHEVLQLLRSTDSRVLAGRMAYQAQVDAHNAQLAELDTLDARLLGSPEAKRDFQAARKQDRILSLASAAGGVAAHAGSGVVRFLGGGVLGNWGGALSLLVATATGMIRHSSWAGRRAGEISMEQCRLMRWTMLVAECAICLDGLVSLVQNEARVDDATKSYLPGIAFGMNLAGVALTVAELRLRQTGYASSALMYSERFDSVVTREARAAGPITTKPLIQRESDEGVRFRVSLRAQGTFDIYLEESDPELLPPMTTLVELPGLRVEQPQ